MELRSDLEGWTQESLDDLVHDLKSMEASAINNEGRESQIEYILSAQE